MKSRLFAVLIMILTLTASPLQALAYSYGDPGEEPLAEAYKELEKYAEQGDWDEARKVYESYQKEFDLYFTKTKPFIEQALEEQNKELLLESYQAALRLNIERRLHFAQDNFENYGEAKLLLAKARGTFNVLEPLVIEREGQEAADAVYEHFDNALSALGNPGLFGIGNQDSDEDEFTRETEAVLETLAPIFPLPVEDDDESHLTEENLDLNEEQAGSSSFWLWFTVGLAVVFVAIVLIGRRKRN
ncbi:hypothetical protein [Bacillus marinisedimentorum]|uniref:hypothetical protein n=1 Tax=Bacillus marinisedimentorum TaxID=1821260 RepID=UPI0008734741|nr:hypothetical protein [Bacillus marinisedimentorum]